MRRSGSGQNENELYMMATLFSERVMKLSAVSRDVGRDQIQNEKV